MIKGFGSQQDKYEQNFSSIGGMQGGQQFGASPAVAPVPLLKNANIDNLKPLSEDTVQVGEQTPPPMDAGEGMFGDLKYTLPLWYVLGKGVDLYNNKCSGEYLDSLPAKIGRFGDRIANSKLGNNAFVQNAGAKLSQAKANAVSQLRKNSNIIRNLMDVHTNPQWEIPSSEMHSTEQKLAHEIKQHFNNYLGGGDKKLKNLVPSRAEKDFLNSIFKGGGRTIDKINALQLYRSNPAKYKDALSINAVLSQRVSNPNIIKETILKELGYDLATFDKYLANPAKYTKELREFALKAGPQMKVYHGNYFIGGPIFRRKVDMSQLGNKMLSISKDAVDAVGKNLPPTTALGRGISKAMQGFMRGLTFGGGKLGLLIFVAPAIVDMVKNTKEAPDDQKAGTIAHGLVESVSWVATFPLSMQLMHRVGGLRYLGMSKNQVACYRDAFEKFKEANEAGKFTSEKMYNEAWKKVKDIRKPTTKLNIFEKGLKFLGMGITNDLEMRPAWKNPNLKGLGSVRNSLRWKSIGNGLRHLTGIARVPLFFVTMAFALSPLITKPLEWIFGKPYDRHEEAAKKAEAEQARIAAEQAQQPSMPIVNPSQTEVSQPQLQPVQPVRTTQSQTVVSAIDAFNNKLDNAKQEQTGLKMASVQSQEQTVKNEDRYIPSQNCGIPRDSGEFNERTYMPNQNSQVVKLPEEIQGLDTIEQRARRAEEEAINILSRRV